MNDDIRQPESDDPTRRPTESLPGQSNQVGMGTDSAPATGQAEADAQVDATSGATSTSAQNTGAPDTSTYRFAGSPYPESGRYGYTAGPDRPYQAPQGVPYGANPYTQQPGYTTAGYTQPDTQNAQNATQSYGSTEGQYGNGYGYQGYAQSGYAQQGYGPNSAYGGYGQPPYSGNYPGAFGPGPQKPRKPKRTWSSAILAMTAGIALVLGGMIGAGISIAVDDHAEASATPSSQSQDQGTQTLPQLPGNSSNPQQSDPGASSTADSGTVVDSAPGVVLINTTLTDGTGAGTGMIIDSSGIVITNYHVVSDSETVTLTIADSGKQYSATVLGHDATNDVAVLQITGGSDFDTVTTNTDTVKAGQQVSALGNGSGQGYLTQLDGTVTGLDQTITAQDSSSASGGETLTGLIETDADVVAGYSGGPLMNSDGEVIGITTAASTGNTSADISGYAIPIATALDIAQKVLAGESSDTIVIGRDPALGVMISDGQTGVTIVQVLTGSGAEAAGLVAGDVITAIDGTAVSSASALSDAVLSHSVGDSVALTVTGTDGTSSTVNVTLGESSVN